MKKSYYILTIISVLIGGIIIGFLGYYIYDDNTNTSNTNDTQNKLYVYGDKKLNNICKQRGLNCPDVVLEIETETNNAMILDVGRSDDESYFYNASGDFTYVLYVDNGMKLYDVNSKKIKKIDVNDSDKEIIDNFGSFTTYQLMNNGFIYEDYYYDLKNDKKMFSDYDYLNKIYYYYNGSYGSIDEYSNDYLYATKDGVGYILDIKNNKVVLKRSFEQEDNHEFGAMFFRAPFEESIVFFITYDVYFDIGTSDICNIKVYNQKGEEIVKLSNDETLNTYSGQEAPGDDEHDAYAFGISKSKITNISECYYDENGKLVKCDK